VNKALAGALAALGYPGLFWFGAWWTMHPCGIPDAKHPVCVFHLAMEAGVLFAFLVTFVILTVAVIDLYTGGGPNWPLQINRKGSQSS